MTKVCTKCNLEKSLEEYFRRSDRPGGRMYECKICHYNRFEVVNVEKARARSKRFRIKNKEREQLRCRLKQVERRKASPKWLTNEQKQAIKEFYRDCPKGYHVDHIIPIAGKNVRG